MNRSVHTSRYQSQFTHCENFISFKKTCCVTAYMYLTARVLFKPMLNGTTWFIIRQRHWLDLSVIRPPVWKRCWAGDSSSYSQHVVCVTHRGILCVTVQWPSDLWNMDNCFLWFIIDECRVWRSCVCVQQECLWWSSLRETFPWTGQSTFCLLMV